MDEHSAGPAPTILLLGKDGQLGSELQRSLSESGRLISMGHRECDLAEPAVLETVLHTLRPDIVVNAAAYTQVDRAETERHTAFEVNALAPGIMARHAARTGALLVHYSTDYVFDGTAALPYTEEDLPRPLSCYAASKLAGEQAIQTSACRALILRTSWVYAAHGNNFVRTILRLAAERYDLDVVADQLGVPNPAPRIAEATASMISRYRAAPRDFPGGLYHMSAAQAVSRHAYACAIVEIARRLGLKPMLETSAIRPVATARSEDSGLARRPGNCVLNSQKLARIFGIQLPAWREDLESVIASLVKTMKGTYA